MQLDEVEYFLFELPIILELYVTTVNKDDIVDLVFFVISPDNGFF